MGNLCDGSSRPPPHWASRPPRSDKGLLCGAAGRAGCERETILPVLLVTTLLTTALAIGVSVWLASPSRGVERPSPGGDGYPLDGLWPDSHVHDGRAAIRNDWAEGNAAPGGCTGDSLASGHGRTCGRLSRFGG